MKCKHSSHVRVAAAAPPEFASAFLETLAAGCADCQFELDNEDSPATKLLAIARAARGDSPATRAVDCHGRYENLARFVDNDLEGAAAVEVARHVVSCLRCTQELIDSGKLATTQRALDEQRAATVARKSAWFLGLTNVKRQALPRPSQGISDVPTVLPQRPEAQVAWSLQAYDRWPASSAPATAHVAQDGASRLHDALRRMAEVFFPGTTSERARQVPGDGAALAVLIVAANGHVHYVRSEPSIGGALRMVFPREPHEACAALNASRVPTTGIDLAPEDTRVTKDPSLLRWHTRSGPAGLAARDHVLYFIGFDGRPTTRVRWCDGATSWPTFGDLVMQSLGALARPQVSTGHDSGPRTAMPDVFEALLAGRMAADPASRRLAWTARSHGSFTWADYVRDAADARPDKTTVADLLRTLHELLRASGEPTPPRALTVCGDRPWAFVDHDRPCLETTQRHSDTASSRSMRCADGLTWVMHPLAPPMSLAKDGIVTTPLRPPGRSFVAGGDVRVTDPTGAPGALHTQHFAGSDAVAVDVGRLNVRALLEGSSEN